MAVAVLVAAPQQQPRFEDRIDVLRLLIDARVVDGSGEPVRDLGPGDFAVEMDGRRARVESAQWIEGGGVDEIGRPLAGSAVEGTAMPGRLIVFLFQKDFEPSRIIGLMRMLVETRRFLEGFTPADRVAVLSFDTHLKIWLDFTNDLPRVDAVLRRGILFERVAQVETAEGVSLLWRLDPARARRTYTMEEALLLVAEALAPLRGAKSLVIVGHGFGRYMGGGVRIEDEYAAARTQFQRGRVSVFALDTTMADRHSLEAGLIRVAEDTGGFFERTHLSATRGLDRLAGALSGHYVLFVERPEGLRAGSHRIEVKVARRGATVLAKRMVAG
jgi:VWFA-related protein